MQRHDGRTVDQMRMLTASYDVIEYADSAVLLSLGKTKVLCAVTLQNGVPAFMRASKDGWLTAEYALLPAATHQRTPREISLMKRNARSIEISRLIGRVLRVVTNLNVIPAKTVIIDCDVIQADGGTRVAAIIGAYLALARAEQNWLQNDVIQQPLMTSMIAALSVGVIGNTVLLDPDYTEDNKLDADFNFIMTSAGNLIEINGGAERAAISWSLFDIMRSVAARGADRIFSFITSQVPTVPENNTVPVPKTENKSPLFSLKNRLSSTL